MRRTMTGFYWRFLLAAVLLAAGTMAPGQEGADAETVVLSPFQVFASSLEMSAHYTLREGKKTLGFIRVKHVAPGSMADRAGLKKGDRIVAIGGWRLEGQELTALNRDFPTKLEDGVPVLTVTVRHSTRDEEREVRLR